MAVDQRQALLAIKRFDQLIAYLRDELGWPISKDSFDDVDDLFYDFSPEELGIDPKTAAKIQEIKRLRPLSSKQPWGIFFVKFEPKKLPIVVLRKILSQVALKKRVSANNSDRTAWSVDDLLFISNYGEGEARQISFAHFLQSPDRHDLPTLKVLGWDNQDTALHLDSVVKELTEHLAWPEDVSDIAGWRQKWRSAFTLGHREVINTSRDLSVRLAELASSIRDRIKISLSVESDKGPLTQLMRAFQKSLVHDLDADDFADTYAQTIAYGLLSSRIADPKKRTADDFASHMRTNPFLRELMETFLKVGGRQGKAGGPGIDFDELGVSEIIDLLDEANMEAVVRDFGDRNPQEDPVIHFYELFLKEYDAKKRMQRGVFYTPRPVVSYIVRSIDALLRTEFGLEDGLADTTSWGEMVKRHKDIEIPEGISHDQDFVQILDPATGTGTFLVEALELIYQTLVAKWKLQGASEKKIDELWNDYVPKHLLTRLHGYEMLMAPYAIAHLKIGLKLYETRYLFGGEERARIYLTNALEQPQDLSGTFTFAISAIAHEAEAVKKVKLGCRFTVVIGNPPYAGHSLNNQLAWIVDKTQDYKRGYADLQKPGQSKWLQDDYVKFLRFAEWQVERSNCGLIGFITNHAWLDNPTFKGMRKHFLDSFNLVAVLDLHGNANKKERSVDGSVDKNVFDIKQGVAISLLGNTPNNLLMHDSTISRSDLFGSDSFKYETLGVKDFYQLPTKSFKPLPPELIFAELDDARKQEYDAFTLITQIMGENGDPAPGIVTTHDEFAISFSKEEQINKVEEFLQTSNEGEARKKFKLCSQNQWIYGDAKRELNKEDWRNELVPILYRPFDMRWTVFSRYVAVHRRERVSKHLRGTDNLGLISVRQVAEGVFSHALVCNSLVESRITISNKGIGFVLPLWLEPEWPDTKRRANLSIIAIKKLEISTSLAYLQDGNLSNFGRGDLKKYFGSRDVFDFIYSILHSNIYRDRYIDFLKGDFARIPLTPSKNLFCDLVSLGSELVDLHLLKSKKLETYISDYTGPINAEVEKISWKDESVWIDKAQTIGFNGIREDIWNFQIAGYQVCDKWLKDRKARLLIKDDIEHYKKILTCISETLIIMKKIDLVIEEHGGWPNAFAAKNITTLI